MTNKRLYTMIFCALMAAIIALCAWICVPVGDMVFTLQTFAVAISLLLLGGKKGSICIALYLALGIVGLPVFSGFRGGIGILLGATGGYIWGFLIWSSVYWLITTLAGEKSRLPALVLGLIACYLFGSLWFYRLYAPSLPLILVKCVVPYLLPDALKLWLGWFLAKRLKRFVY